MKKGRCFFGAFTVTMCLLLLGCGCLWAEFNTRNTLGESGALSPPIEVADAVARLSDTARILPLKSRVLLLLFEWECDTAARWMSR